MKPNFFIIVSPKFETFSLSNYLNNHNYKHNYVSKLSELTVINFNHRKE